jgi:hypothetical protein
MKLRETKKLHYNRYLYKLSIPNHCASYFRTEFQKDGHLNYARQRLDVLHQNHNRKEGYIKIPWGQIHKFYDKIPVEDYYDAIIIYRHLKNKSNYTIRCETRNLNLYSNDRKFLISLSNKLRHNFIEFWEPAPENTEKLLTGNNIILVDKPPRYEYKIILGRKKGLSSLASWIDANPKLAKMGDVAKEECYNEGWVKGYYFFVRDKKSLLVAQMLVGDNIQKVYRLVYRNE